MLALVQRALIALQARFLGWRYSATALRHDLLAGCSVALVAIPQAMAYAIVAGVPPEYGLYTLIIHCTLGGLLNASGLIALGPVNTQSLLVASVVSHLSMADSALTPDQQAAAYLQLVVALTFVKGVVQLALAAAHMASLVKYVSNSVVIGFTSGAGVLIACGQLPEFLGIDVSQVPRHLPGLAGTFEQVSFSVWEVNGNAVLIGLISLATALLARYTKLISGPIMAVIVAVACVWLFGWTQADIPLLEPLMLSLPRWTFPVGSVQQFESLLASGLAVSVLTILENHSVSKSIATERGERVSANAELAAQGWIHLLSSFFQCIPGSVSLSRSALNVYAGAQTRMAGVYCALVCGGLMWFLAPLAGYIPYSSLAAMLIVVGFRLFDWRYFRYALRADFGEAIVLCGTFGATLLLPLHYAIFLGVFLSLTVYLRRASQLQLVELIPTTDGKFIERPFNPEQTDKDFLFLQLEGDLFFGIADELEEKLSLVAASKAQVVLFRLKRTRIVDSSCLGVFEHFIVQVQQRQGHVLLCGAKQELLEKLDQFGLLKLVGQENVFPTTEGIFASARQGMQRAVQLLNQGEATPTAGLERFAVGPHHWDI